MKRTLCFILALILCAALLPASALAADRVESNGCPYYITVNRRMNCVTVYALEDGYYTKPVRAMICSTGKPGDETPLGTYAINDQKYTWCGMIDGSYGQYACSFYGNYMFHSVCYRDTDRSQLMYDEYNDLGSSVSHGCVRLQTMDAKWIYDNCPVGTLVNVYESDEPGPLGRPEKKVPLITESNNNGWDPTDPDPDNPWLIIKPTGIIISQSAMLLTAGEARALTARVTPDDAVYSSIVWSSDNPSVASVSGGTVLALSAGTAIITASCEGFTARCTVTVTGTPLPFTDVIAGMWYYPFIRTACELGIFTGITESIFMPDVGMNRAMLAEVLYNMQGRPDMGRALSAFEDVAEDDWFYNSVRWASSAAVVEGMTETTFDPFGELTREQAAVMLYRYYVRVLGRTPDGFTELDAYSDSDSVSGYARDAMSWAVGCGIIEGVSDTELSPRTGATRAQAAALLCRFAKAFC